MFRHLINPKVSVCVIFVSSMFMSIMDSTIVNVTLPTLVRQLHTSNTTIEAVVTGYVVSLAVVIPASGWLGDRWGTKRVFLIALALFSAASALCGQARSAEMLIWFRVLQGAAGGALTPVGTAILYRTFPPQERVQVSRVLMIPTVIAPAMGPILGGFLVDHFTWNWVFYVNVPIGVAVCIFGFFFLQEHREPAAGRFDIAGFLSAGIGLALLLYALGAGPTYGWATPNTLVSAVAGILILVAFVAIELRIKEPMIDLRLLRDRLFRTANLASFFSGAGFLGLLYTAPLFLQEGRHETALMSGLTTFPEAVGVILSTQLVARLYPLVGPRRLMGCGLICVAALISLFWLMGGDTSLWWMRLLMFLVGAGMAFAFLPSQAAGFATISSADTGRASALNSAQRQLGGAFGIAVCGSMLGVLGQTTLNASGVEQPNLAAYHVAFLASALLVLVASTIAFRISDRDAAITMQRRKRGAAADTEGVEPALGMD
ncbi:MAG: multidrug efflux MFS transporter [Ktedonobacteraceae bacterium]|nr:multidrug efflux MFS transporter [Ktedonobacteraceae bacterium]MBO0793082.1 multidrug efflux MFS transporter [Ktedonobacteraceae bacterium]